MYTEPAQRAKSVARASAVSDRALQQRERAQMRRNTARGRVVVTRGPLEESRRGARRSYKTNFCIPSFRKLTP